MIKQLAFGIAMMTAVPAMAAPPHNIDTALLLVQEWDYRDVDCRADIEANRDTTASCDQRDILAWKLNQLGYCNYKPGESHAQMVWRYCRDYYNDTFSALKRQRMLR